MSRKLFNPGVLFLCFVLNNISYAQSDDFGRLFTAPEERQELQILRTFKGENKGAIVAESSVANVAADTDRMDNIMLNGFVYRKDGKNTAWLNGVNTYIGDKAADSFRVGKHNISSNRVSVLLPKFDIQVDLKVGESYDIDDKSRLDMMKDADSMNILKH